MVWRGTLTTALLKVLTHEVIKWTLRSLQVTLVHWPRMWDKVQGTLTVCESYSLTPDHKEKRVVWEIAILVLLLRRSIYSYL